MRAYLRHSACFISVYKAAAWLLAAGLSMSAGAMTELAEEDLGGVTGEGLTFPFEDIRFQMAPTSFIEVTGVNFASCGEAGAPAACTYLKRGDLRYYGLSMTRGAVHTGVASNKDTYTIWNTGTTHWNGTACTGGTYGLGCPLSDAGIINYSNVDNPFLLRAFNYNRMGYGGSNIDQTVLEFIGPSNTDPFRWAFWGEAESNRQQNYATGAITGTRNILQSQTLILGKPAARNKPVSRFGADDYGANANAYKGPVLRLFQDNASQSLGLTYTSRLSGDFRFSVNQSGSTLDQPGVPPVFSSEEGLYFREVNAHLALGQLNYQSLTFDRVAAGNGNFVLELTKIPNTPGVINEFYQLPTKLAATSQCDAACQEIQRGYNRVKTAISENYYATHGYVEWGTKFPALSWTAADCAAAYGVGSCSAAQLSTVPTNVIEGTGVSKVRFSGRDPDGPTLTVNSTNFPAATCNGSAQYGISGSNNRNCTAWNGGTVGDLFDANATDLNYKTNNTRGDVLAAGGISFASKDSNTYWSVRHNQNEPRQEFMLWVAGYCLDDPWWGGCQDNPNPAGRRLEVDDRYRHVNNRNASGEWYNPNLQVNAINLGSSRILGLQFNHLKVTSLGAN